MAVCAGCSYLYALPTVGWLAEGGIIRNMGQLQMPPTLLSPADIKLMALLAAVCAGNFVGLLLYLLPRYPFLSLPGLYWPFAILAVAAPFMTHPEGVWHRGLLSGLGFPYSRPRTVGGVLGCVPAAPAAAALALSRTGN
jgi:hypothetical protein